VHRALGILRSIGVPAWNSLQTRRIVLPAASGRRANRLDASRRMMSAGGAKRSGIVFFDAQACMRRIGRENPAR
jgi:hypothetical protein